MASLVAKLRRTRKRLLVRSRRMRRNHQLILSLVAVAVGAAAGGGSILFREAINLVQLGALGISAEEVYSLALNLPWWHLLLAPAIGGLIVGLFIHYALPGRRPHAVADVIEASALRGGRMSLRTGIAAAVASAASIGAGASVGREGPVVHLGASMASWLGQRLHLGRPSMRTVLGCGIAAAIAASFNAPIAGVFFALEVVVGHYALTAFAPIVIASVMGTIVSRLYFGNFPAFIIPPHEIVSFWEFPAFALLGVVSAAVAVALMRAIEFVERIGERSTLPVWLRPAAAGLATGFIALAFPQVLGVGYEATDTALKGGFELWLLIALVAAKTAATAICVGGGFAGGMFSPSLVIGAMLGGAYGIIATSAFPDLSSGTGAYTLIGMGAVAACIVGAPISTIFIIFELTGNFELTIAVMIAVVIASLIVQQTVGHSFFTGQLARRGINVRGGREINILRAMPVDRIMDRAVATLPPGAALADVRHRLAESPGGAVFLVGEGGRLEGMITFAGLSEHALDTSHDHELTAIDLSRRHPPALDADDDLEQAVRLFASAGEPHIPVVEDHDGMRLVGVLHEHETMLAYHRAMLEARREELGEA
jgi:CIC family chloride channel protein